ncbi:MAG TPA: nucleotidyltransferase family protein [bacterium]|nr:nucleotidyltransferase family protein [bacterium]
MSKGSNIKEELRNREELLPLLEYFLKEKNPYFSFPEETGNKIRQTRINIIVRNALFLSEFEQILENLKQAGISVILLKGLMMEGMYPDGLRTFSDIDLLVRKEDMCRAGMILKRLGYSENSEPRKEAVNIRKNAGYAKGGAVPVIVECHYRLGPCPYMDRPEPYRLFRDSRTVRIGNVDARVLSYEDLLIHLALHIFSHIPNSCIVSVCDIRQIVTYCGDDIDWEVFIEKVDHYRLAMPVRFALEKAMELFEIPIPAYVLGKLAEIKNGRRENFIFKLMKSRKTLPANLGKLFFGFRTVRKIRLILCMTFPSRRYILERYKSAKPGFFLFYYSRYIKENFTTAFLWLTDNL